jgi:hypothetical protein
VQYSILKDRPISCRSLSTSIPYRSTSCRPARMEPQKYMLIRGIVISENLTYELREREKEGGWVKISVAEPHHFYAAPVPGKNFDAAPAPAPTLLYSKAKCLK